MKQALPAALAAAGVLLALRRRRRRRGAGGPSDESVSDFTSQASFTDASVDGDSIVAAHHRALPPVAEAHEHPEPSGAFRAPGSALPGWEQLLVMALAVLAIGVGVQRKAWDLVAIMGTLLTVLVASAAVRAVKAWAARSKAGRSKNKRRKRSSHTRSLWVSERGPSGRRPRKRACPPRCERTLRT